MDISKETLSLIENFRDDAKALQEKSNEAFSILKQIAMNERILDGDGLYIGEFFSDKKGEVGVFLGAKGSNFFGRMITTKHHGYVYPVYKLSYKEALNRISERINDLI